LDVIKNSGADILRLWAASSDYNEDIRVSSQIITRLSEAYRKIRNTCRFILSNLNDFDPDKDSVSYDDLKRIDRWVLGRTEAVRDLVTKRFEEFEFNLAFQALYNFCNEELSMYYLDMAKGRLYTAGKDSRERRACQTAMYTALDALTRMIAPILVFTSDEIWRYLPKRSGEAAIKSVHLLPWPQPNARYRDEGIEKEMGPVLELLPEITKALEEKRTSGAIGSSFDAKIILLTKDENRYKYLGSLGADLPEIFKVSQVETQKVETLPAGTNADTDIGVSVEKADGAKCERCWNYSGTVGKDAVHPALCGKCRDIVIRFA
jgi:isoleucyl-tRNA synthetase